MRRRVWGLAIAVPALLIGLDTAYWYFVAHRLEAGVQRFLARRHAAWSGSAATVGIGGWPFVARVSVGGLSVQGEDHALPGGLRWTAEHAAVQITLFRPNVVEVLPQGPQTLRLGHAPAVPFSAAALEGTITLRLDRSVRGVNVLVRGLRAAFAQGNSTTPMTLGLLRADVTTARPAKPDDVTAHFTLSAEAITLPDTQHWPLGRTVSSFALSGVVNGAIPMGEGIAKAATQWRDAGGSIGIQNLAVGWGPLGLSGAATLALDDQLQPMGAGNGKLVGYAAALDALAANGALTHSAATAAKAVLSLLANSPGEGEPAEVDVPLTLQYRTLSMRQVPLVRFPELDWPRP